MKNQRVSSAVLNLVALIAGLLAAQAIGTLQVYLSNRYLYQSMQLVQRAGYLAVPSEKVWPMLLELKTAFWGGLFFTLSIGAGLSVTALLAAWIWAGIFKRNRLIGIFFLLIWFSGIAAVNMNGFSGLATTYFVIVPSVVFLTAKFLQPERKQVRGWYRAAGLVVPVILILAFLPLAQRSIFTDIRDMILLRNAIGRKINDFYYDYTLFAAQAFKPLSQKSIRTCSLVLTENESHRRVIENIFLARDYLAIKDGSPVDLSVVEQNGKLHFEKGNQTILTATLREFAAEPSLFLQRYSKETDRFGPLRLLTFGSMVTGAPLCLYLILHGLFYLAFVCFMERRRAQYAALLACLLTGLAVTLPLYTIQNVNVNMNNLHALLRSGDIHERVAVLRFVAINGGADEKFYRETEGMLTSPHLVERYSYIRALGSSTSLYATKTLLAALDDTSINVVCAALYALGRQKNAAAVKPIMKWLANSDKWYEQHYGYRALRALGWKQGRI